MMKRGSSVVQPPSDAAKRPTLAGDAGSSPFPAATSLFSPDVSTKMASDLLIRLSEATQKAQMHPGSREEAEQQQDEPGLALSPDGPGASPEPPSLTHTPDGDAATDTLASDLLRKLAERQEVSSHVVRLKEEEEPMEIDTVAKNQPITERMAVSSVPVNKVNHHVFTVKAEDQGLSGNKTAEQFEPRAKMADRCLLGVKLEDCQPGSKTPDSGISAASKFQFPVKIEDCGVYGAKMADHLLTGVKVEDQILFKANIAEQPFSRVNMSSKFFSGVKMEDQFPSGAKMVVQFPSGVKVVDQFPSGVKMEDRCCSGPKMEDQFPTGAKMVDWFHSGAKMENQLVSAVKIENQFPSGLKLEDQFRLGAKMEDQLPSSVKLENKFPSGVKTENQFPSGLKLEDQFHLGAKMEDQFPSTVKLENKFPLGVKMENQFPSGVKMENQLVSGAKMAAQVFSAAKTDEQLFFKTKMEDQFTSGAKMADQCLRAVLWQDMSVNLASTLLHQLSERVSKSNNQLTERTTPPARSSPVLKVDQLRSSPCLSPQEPPHETLTSLSRGQTVGCSYFFRCHACGFETDGHALFQSHMTEHRQWEHDSFSLHCCLCDLSTNQEAEMRAHVVTHAHGDAVEMRCPVALPAAAAAPSSAPAVAMATQPEKSTSEHRCRICQRSFPGQQELLVHFQGHRQGNQYRCDRCGHLTRTANKLVEHVRVHTGERPFTCDLCPYSAKRRDSLRLHCKVKHAGAHFDGRAADLAPGGVHTHRSYAHGDNNQRSNKLVQQRRLHTPPSAHASAAAPPSSSSSLPPLHPSLSDRAGWRDLSPLLPITTLISLKPRSPSSSSSSSSPTFSNKHSFLNYLGLKTSL